MKSCVFVVKTSPLWVFQVAVCKTMVGKVKSVGKGLSQLGYYQYIYKLVPIQQNLGILCKIVNIRNKGK